MVEKFLGDLEAEGGVERPLLQAVVQEIPGYRHARWFFCVPDLPMFTYALSRLLRDLGMGDWIQKYQDDMGADQRRDSVATIHETYQASLGYVLCDVSLCMTRHHTLYYTPHGMHHTSSPGTNTRMSAGLPLRRCLGA
jgi:hypothetical protein